MKKKFVVSLLILIVKLSFNAVAQSNYSSKVNGLIYGRLGEMIKDENGVIWMSADRLGAYAGPFFEIIKLGPNGNYIASKRFDGEIASIAFCNSDTILTIEDDSYLNFDEGNDYSFLRLKKITSSLTVLWTNYFRIPKLPGDKRVRNSIIIDDGSEHHTVAVFFDQYLILLKISSNGSLIDAKRIKSSVSNMSPINILKRNEGGYAVLFRHWMPNHKANFLSLLILDANYNQINHKSYHFNSDSDTELFFQNSLNEYVVYFNSSISNDSAQDKNMVVKLNSSGDFLKGISFPTSYSNGRLRLFDICNENTSTYKFIGLSISQDTLINKAIIGSFDSSLSIASIYSKVISQKINVFYGNLTPLPEPGQTLYSWGCFGYNNLFSRIDYSGRLTNFNPIPCNFSSDIGLQFSILEAPVNISLSYIMNTTSITTQYFDDMENSPYVSFMPVCNDLSIEEEIVSGSFADLYPNPSDGIVQFNNWSSINEIKVYNISGKLVLKENNSFKNIDLSFLPSAMYFVEVYRAGGKLTRNKILIMNK